MERHYLLSGDADGTIMLWELSLIDQKVGFFPLVLFILQAFQNG